MASNPGAMTERHRTEALAQSVIDDWRRGEYPDLKDLRIHITDCLVAYGAAQAQPLVEALVEIAETQPNNDPIVWAIVQRATKALHPHREWAAKDVRLQEEL